MVKVVENTLILMERSMKVNGRMGNIMVKEHTFFLMEVSMWGDVRIIKNLIKEQLLL